MTTDTFEAYQTERSAFLAAYRALPWFKKPFYSLYI